uniref:RAP domain-containing protein n=1 Tax=Ciona savignyi TaxID=51511 RepID=H2Z693_CIOSA
MLDRFVTAVKKNMSNLDFVALSDILDSLAQVYFLPKNAEEFFEQLHMEMLRKLPTLKTSHVHNANRKLLLTAFHFAVFGRYPETLIKLTLEDKQFINNRSGSRFFMKDLCKAVSIERPDLLPPSIPTEMFMDTKPPQIYAFEKDVRHFLTNLVGGYHNYSLISSPVRNFPVFLLRMRLDGELLPATRHPSFIPPHMHQMIQNVAVVPLPRSRFCIGSRHAIGKTRLVLRLLRAQGARVVVVPHFDWDGKSSARKINLLRSKIFTQKADDTVE